MASPKVILDLAFPEFLATLFEGICEFVAWEALERDGPTRAAITGMLTYAHPQVGAQELSQLPNLKVISNYGVGVDHIDLDAAARARVPVGNTPGLVDGATADLTLALLLALARNVTVGDRFARGPDFTYYDPANLLGRDVFGATLGIVGMGRIGSEVAKRARGFDMRILYHNRQRDREAEERFGSEYRPLAALLAEADFVSLNMPLTSETRHFIGATEFGLMKSSAYLINTARGGVIDHDALLNALDEGQIAGAAIDVTEPEPLPRDHPLLTRENLLITPHLGTSTFDTRLAMGELTRDNLVAGLRGASLPHQAK